jgi:hypothetical protein
MKELDFEPDKSRLKKEKSRRDLEAQAEYNRKYNRERYQNDPDHAEKVKERARENWKANKRKLQDQQNLRRKGKPRKTPNMKGSA